MATLLKEFTITGAPNIKYKTYLDKIERSADNTEITITLTIKAYLTNSGAHFNNGYGLRGRFQIRRGKTTATAQYKTIKETGAYWRYNDGQVPQASFTIQTTNKALIEAGKSLAIDCQVAQTTNSIYGTAGVFSMREMGTTTIPSLNFTNNGTGKFGNITQDYNNKFYQTIETPKIGTQNTISNLKASYTFQQGNWETEKEIPFSGNWEKTQQTYKELENDIPTDFEDINLSGQMSWTNTKGTPKEGKTEFSGKVLYTYTQTKIKDLNLSAKPNNDGYIFSCKCAPGNNLVLKEYEIIINDTSILKKAIENISNSEYTIEEEINIIGAFQLFIIIRSGIKEGKTLSNKEIPKELIEVSENISTKAIPLYFYNNNKEETQVEQIIFYDEDSKQIEIDQVYYFDSNGNKTLVFQKSQEEA